jgi:hypothetical protein
MMSLPEKNAQSVTGRRIDSPQPKILGTVIYSVSGGLSH